MLAVACVVATDEAGFVVLILGIVDVLGADIVDEKFPRPIFISA